METSRSPDADGAVVTSDRKGKIFILHHSNVQEALSDSA